MVQGAHPAIVRDQFFERYGWSFRDYQQSPEWLLEEQFSVMQGLAEGASTRPADGGSLKYAADMRSAAEIAQSNGLMAPSTGWPTSG